ncbi:hypothetical protein I4F81_009702 [Pyropia yezoensis]|uniref:Uncharacterized protein n=1 Tax=Pyropia yezoensis TaxID=2788 RepID=A0ACC3CAE9_PYRYE|nr:hypothetical protein I4F81_009702 [Neopyropia yezoensis]
MDGPAWTASKVKPLNKRECRLCKSSGEQCRHANESTAMALRRNPLVSLPAPAVRFGVTSDAIEDLPIMRMARFRGWARDYSTLPDPDMLESHPRRLHPDKCVSVDAKVTSIFKCIAGAFVSGLGKNPGKAGVRQPAYYIRASPGIGKTFLLFSVWRWWLQRRSDALHAAAQRLDRSSADTLAPSLELYSVSFNGKTAVCDDETTWAAESGAVSSLFGNLRLCYAELIDPSIPWVDFVEAVYEDVLDGKQRVYGVGVAVRKILRFRRGRSTAVPLLLVDELSKSSELFEKPLLQYDKKKFGSWPALIRSQFCQRMQVAGGAVLFASVDKTLMTAETKSSGRSMEQACRVGYFPAMDYLPAVQYGLAPLTKDPEGHFAIGKMLQHSDVDGAYTLMTMNKMKSILSENGGVMGDIEAEKAIDVAVVSAGITSGVQPLVSSFPGGMAGAWEVLAHVLLGREVESSARVLEHTLGSTVDDTWDDVAASGIISLEDRYPAMLPWTLLGLRTLLAGFSDPFFASLLTLLKFDGDRPTGTWLESFFVNWEVMISHARSRFPALYSRTTLQSLLCSRSPDAYVGSSHLINNVMVDGAQERSFGVHPRVLKDLLATALRSPGILFKSMYRLYTENAQPGVATDAAAFYRVVQDSKVPGSNKTLKEGSAVLVLYQIKDTGADSKVPAQTEDVRKSLKNLTAAIGEENWKQWKNRIVFVLIDRRSGKLLSSTVDSSVSFRSSDMGKQCVLLTGADLPGLFGAPLHDTLCASEFLKSEAVSNLSLFTDEVAEK